MIIELKGYVVDNASGFNLVYCLNKHIYEWKKHEREEGAKENR